MKIWGLALSGGIAHGMANVGIWEALEEAKLIPNAIAASSMGAIVGALVALGYTSKDLRELCGKITLLNIVELRKKPFEGGLHAGLLRPMLEKHLAPLVGNARIADCKIPFLCVAGEVREHIRWERVLEKDFNEYARQCFRPVVLPPETLLLEALLATSALPVLFSPITIGEHSYIDLCNFGSVPIAALREAFHPDVIIATDTQPRLGKVTSYLPSGWRKYSEEGEQELETSLKEANLVIRPDLRTPAWRFDRGLEFVESGKKVTEKKLEEIRQLIDV